MKKLTAKEKIIDLNQGLTPAIREIRNKRIVEA